MNADQMLHLVDIVISGAAFAFAVYAFVRWRRTRTSKDLGGVFLLLGIACNTASPVLRESGIAQATALGLTATIAGFLFLIACFYFTYGPPSRKPGTS